MTKCVAAMMAAVVLTGCGGAHGKVTFTTWGESYIEEGIPAQQGEEVGFVDGWSLKYSKFLVVLQEAKISTAMATSPAFQQAGAAVFDLTKKGPFDVVSTGEISAQRYDEVSFAIAPSSEPKVGGATAPADVDAVKAANASIIIHGTATKAAVTKSFSWSFSTDTLYADCQNADLGGVGVNVAAGGSETVQLTVHGDHFFYDDLQSDDAKLRFDAIAAADVNPADGTITADELAAVQLTSLPITQYGTGGASSVKTLKDFVTALSRTIGHYRGEGHCESMAR